MSFAGDCFKSADSFSAASFRKAVSGNGELGFMRDSGWVREV